jgi:3-oxoacyl-[acyl-carrier-protein] synthase-1
MPDVSEADITNERTGIVMGSGGPSTRTLIDAADITRKNGSPKRIGPFAVPKSMSSTASATLATWFKIHGVNYSISSACSTSAHCIGNAAETDPVGQAGHDVCRRHARISTGPCRTCSTRWARCSKYNDSSPTTASRAYDTSRDGFVIAGGAGVLVLEELEHAKARGAKIYAELTGYGATSDGYDMVAPSGEGAVRCMRQALATVKGRVDYVNTHGTSTPVGDQGNRRIREVFGDDPAYVQSTKSLTGHSLGAAGVQEAIYSLLMMQDGFVGESAHIDRTRPGIRRRADRARAHRQREDRHGAVELLRLWRHQRDAGFPASMADRR